MPKLSRAKLEERRQHILRAAAICFDRQGFHRTTIADVRREAAVSTGAIYTYFPNKEAIIRAMLEDAQRTRRAQLDQAADRAEVSSSERTVLLQWAERSFTAEGAQVARINVNLWAEALRDEAVAELARRALDSAAQIVTGVVTREMRRTSQALPAVSPRDVAHVLIAIQLGLEVQRAVGVTLQAPGILRVLDGLFAAEPVAAAPASTPRTTRRAGAAVKRRKARFESPR